jgi:hypothetical protein
MQTIHFFASPSPKTPKIWGRLADGGKAVPLPVLGMTIVRLKADRGKTRRRRSGTNNVDARVEATMGWTARQRTVAAEPRRPGRMARRRRMGRRLTHELISEAGACRGMQLSGRKPPRSWG